MSYQGGNQRKLKSVEKTGKTLEEAIALAIEELGISEDEASITVLENGTRGIFGLGNKPYKVLVKVNEDSGSKAEAFLESVLSDMEISAKIAISYEEDNNLKIELSGTNMGVIIGRHGETLDALQYLTSIVVNKDQEEYTRVTMDTENYRSKRIETLQKLADRIAQRVAKYKKSVTLEPMSPYERRIIHAFLQANDEVTTTSIGEEPNRRIVISSAGARRYER